MELFQYVKVDIARGTDFCDYATVRYEERKKWWEEQVTARFKVIYNAEEKKSLVRRDTVSDILENQYYDDETFAAFNKKVMEENAKRFRDIHQFYDRVYLLLKEPVIDLKPLEVMDVFKAKHRFSLETFNEKHQLFVDLGIDKDGKTLHHFGFRKKKDENWDRVSIQEVDKYQNILDVKNYLVFESDFRLKLLFD